MDTDIPRAVAAADAAGARTRKALDPLRQSLLGTTSAAHAALADTAPMRRLLSPRVRLADLVDVMLRLRAVHAASEALLDPEILPDGAHLARTPLLDADFAALRTAADRLPPRAGAAPALEGAAHWLGYAWVVEGAALGARIVAPHLRRRLGDGLPAMQYYGEGVLAGLDPRTAVLEATFSTLSVADKHAVHTGAARTLLAFAEALQAPARRRPAGR